jgi:hypothetical protein
VQSQQGAGSSLREQGTGERQQRDSRERGSQERQQDPAAEQQSVREEVAHEEIARRAHELWEQDGRPEGRHEEHWMEAEKQLRGSPIGPDARDEARAIKASAERRASGLTRN